MLKNKKYIEVITSISNYNLDLCKHLLVFNIFLNIQVGESFNLKPFPGQRESSHCI